METLKKITIGFVFFFVFMTILAIAMGTEYPTSVVDVKISEENTKGIQIMPYEIERLKSNDNELKRAYELSDIQEVAETEKEMLSEIKSEELIKTESDAAAGFTPLDIECDADIQEYLYKRCEEECVDFALMLALMRVESNFNPDAHSNTNDYGLMQINKCNHNALKKALGVDDITEWHNNIDAGLYMIVELFEDYEEVEPVLMAYHFGRGGAKRLWNEGKHTSKYSQMIMSYQEEYQRMLEER